MTEHHLELLSLKGGCTSSSVSTLVKVPHCWKSHVTAHINNSNYLFIKPYIQRWEDCNIKWNATETGIDALYVPYDTTWRPDITLYDKYVCSFFIIYPLKK